MYDDEIMADEAPKRRHFGIESAVFVLLILLSLGGIFITDFSPDDGYGYWLLMVFVFGVVSVFVSWLQTKRKDLDFGDILKAQAMHWLHTIIVVGAASLLNKSGQLQGLSADLVILLILGLSTLLDGYHIGWQFSLLGFFLVGCTIIIGYVNPFMWACVALAVVIIVGAILRGLSLRDEDD
ncbi:MULTISPECIES: hypothetical protein [Methylomonas]|uniref:Uncharacterized protein n=2 Tax=Methylomonas TaxID=416 RepID=A0A126T4P0_9GAMM|nr:MULTISPECIES: hypothetical protein [Methylomonas]AMK77037.1 hypothetical protein JT25_011150 [Methylomonas denitrificans]OAH96252.1 hypothetical protein A1342_22010 [Methylomonas methanica]TCV76908.1 hypothetical protein EDE11_13129 [Methylomonas methanica]